MKILQETTDEQTLKIIPKSYDTIVNVVITNEQTNEQTTIENLTATQVGGYLEIPYAYDLKEDQFYTFEVFNLVTSGYAIQCEAANNEYMSSPALNYIGDAVGDLNISVEYKNLSDVSLAVHISQGWFNQSSSFQVTTNQVNNQILLRLKDDLGVLIGCSHLYSQDIPTDAIINFKGNGTDIELYLDDNLLDTWDASALGSISGISAFPMYFGGVQQSSDGSLSFIGIPDNVDLVNVITNDNQWTFPEGSGATTTNSQSVVTTLHSDGDVNDMWVGQLSQGSSIFKGRIFCTNQSQYSINDGDYVENTSDTKYKIYE